MRAALVALALLPIVTGAPGTGGAPTAHAAAVSAGAYTPVPATRILDTRRSPVSPIAAGGVRTVTVAGVGGVPPTGVSAVVVNVTVTQPSAGGYLTVWPAGVARPGASSLNFNSQTTVANLVTVRVGANGAVNVYNALGSTHVLIDVVGYYAAATTTPGTPSGRFHPVAISRLVDSRTWEYGPVQPGDYALVPVSYAAGGVNWDPRIEALAVNLTVITPARAGYVVAWDGSGPLPPTSTLNFPAGRNVSNMAIVPVAPCGLCPGDFEGLPAIGILNQSLGEIHLAVDIVGIYDDGTLAGGWTFRPAPTPRRIVDSRADLGTAGPVGTNATRQIDAAGVAIATTGAVVTNTTVVRPTRSTYVTLWPGGPRPNVSNVNASPGAVVANHTITRVEPGNVFDLYHNLGDSDVLVDVVGTLDATGAGLRSSDSTTPAPTDGAAGGALVVGT